LNAGNKWVIKDRKMVDQRVAWIHRAAKAQKVSVRVELDQGKEQIVDSVLQFAKAQKVMLIMLAAKMGRLGSLFGGSVTRQLVRKSPVPMYVIKSKTSSF
jgi:nucleotide-binding universal stress UspA family protein